MKKMEEYAFHAGIKMSGYPSWKQTSMIKANGGSSRLVYNRLVSISNDLVP